MAILEENLEVNEGGLWEMGVVIPINNMDMARFEQQTVLSRSVNAGVSVFYVNGHSSRIKPNSRVYIGPSSDPTRDLSGNLLYYGKSEVFRIESITEVGDEDEIDIKKLKSGYSDLFVNSYLPGDPVVIRPLAESWEFMADDQFPSVSTPADMRTDTDFIYSREDSLDEYKGFSQGISTSVLLTVPVDVGISQVLSGRRANVLNFLQNKTVAFSGWVRVQNAYKMTAGVPGNGLVTPYIIIGFYDDQDALATDIVIVFRESTSFVPERSTNIFISERALCPSNAVSMRVGSYANFTENPDERDLRFHVDNVVVEHVVETSQEANGRYTVDVNPRIGISTSNSSSRSTNKDPSGKIRALKVGDPRLKLSLNATWQNRPGYFINDMRKLENWNKMGYPIALRTKMPGTLPNVIFCNMEVNVSYEQTAGNERGDVQIKFDEVSV